MLIIEGADLVGKTVLSKALCLRLNALGWPHVYQHLSRLPTTWAADAVQNYSRLCSPYVVRDRFHVSEPVYAQARGELPMLTPETYRQVDRLVHCTSGYVIVITASPSLIEQRYREHAAREMYDLDKVLAVNDAYGAMAHRTFGDYQPAIDLYIHCSESNPWVDPGEIALRAYTSRLNANYPYVGARAVSYKEEEGRVVA